MMRIVVVIRIWKELRLMLLAENIVLYYLVFFVDDMNSFLLALVLVLILVDSSLSCISCSFFVCNFKYSMKV